MSERREKISRMILDYLRRNPDASDTLEGISKWWLKREQIELTIDEVSNAIKSLIKKGTINMIRTKEGAIYYKLKKEEEDSEP